MFLNRIVNICLCLILNVGFIIQVQAANPVGSDQGNIEITTDGQAGYTLPITVPPGVLGLVPKLTLSVSQAGQLNLGGLSSITRCTGAYVDHSVVKPVRLLKSDQYCLDGAPLVLVDGVQGEAGSIYHTQIESFQKIQAVGQQGNGPQYFKVKTRTGGTLYFGYSQLSRTTHSSDSTVLSWSISLIVDPSGNRLWYTYKDKSTNSTPEVVLNSILYGAKTYAQAPVRVDFEYEHNGHSRYGYQHGDPVKSTQRLKQITTKADNKVARKYIVTYEQVAPSGVSRVTKIHECPATGNCYRPSVFNYAATQTGWQTANLSQPSSLQDSQGRSRGVVLDINNDGFNDWVIAVQPETGSEHVETWLGNASGGWSSSSTFTLPGPLFDYKINADGIPVGNLADMNGDGLVDYFQAYHHKRADGTVNYSKQMWLNTGDGFAVDAGLKPLSYTVMILADGTVEAFDKYVDVNGDGLPDAVRAMRRKAGTGSRITRLNTSSGWVTSDAYKIPGGYFSDHTVGSQGAYIGELVDINGDGLVDFIESAVITDTLTRRRTYLNTGSGWATSTAYRIPLAATLMDYSVHDKGISNAELADINGDGLIDIWQALRVAGSPVVNHYNAWLNTGEGFKHSPSYTPIDRSTYVGSSGAARKYGEIMDINGDGKPEHVIHYLSESNGSQILRVYEHTGTQWSRNTALENQGLLPSVPFYMQPTQGTLSSRSLLQMADLDGDGSPEAFMSMDTTNGWQIKTNKAKLVDSVQPGYLTQHINGLGIETRLEYGLSTSDVSLYMPADSAQNTRTSVAVNAPMVLVKTVKKMNGLIHPKIAKANDDGDGWYKVDHHYGELKTDLTGRGSLGFKTRAITDERTGISVHSEFYQEYPFSGMPYKSRQQLGDKVLSKTETLTMEKRYLNGGLTTYIYAPETIAKSFDPATGDLLSTTTTTSTYDNYGNLLTKSQVTDGQGQKFEQITTTTYENRDSVNDWLLGLPKSTEVTAKAKDQPDQTNITTATYNDVGYPETETLQPGHAQSLSTTYSYDDFGNVIQTQITNGDDTRTSKTVYTADGRFPTTSINAKLHESKVEIDSRWGKPTKQTNANMLVKITEYDGFGTVLNEDTQWNQTTTRQAREIARPSWCEGNDKCPTNAVYVVAAFDDQGESPQAVYYDAYGRELLKQTTGADLDGNNSANGPAIYIATEYDVQGRKKKTSRPGTNLSNLTYDEVVYDTFGRIKQRTTADGPTTITYDGLTTATRNAEQQVTKVTNDLRGKPVSSVDALNNVTRYEYDAKGNLLRTIDAESNVIEMTYDLFGRKIAMDDPDMGYWEYRYDGFGNLEWQKDAKGSITTMEYDVLNRLEKRTDDDGGPNQQITTWSYDTAGRMEQRISATGTVSLSRKGDALGQLAYVSGPGYKRWHWYDLAGRPVREKSQINGEEYISERGYYRASNKIAWEKYPSGLVLTKEYDPSGYPMTLESGDLEKYQAYLEEYYASEDLVFRITQEEDKHRAQLDDYIELLKGEKTGEDSNGDPIYAGGGLEDQVKPFTDKINQTVSSANNWQSYATEAGQVYTDHAQWADAYHNEYSYYFGEYDKNMKDAEAEDRKAADQTRWAAEDQARANTHYNNYQTAINSIKTKWQAACKAMGKSIYSSYQQHRDYCTNGFLIEGKRYFGLGSGAQQVCWYTGMSASSEQGGYETCKEYRHVYNWLPTFNKTIQEQSGYKEVCDGDSGGGGGGNGVDAGNQFENIIRSLAQNVLNAFIQPSHAEGQQCWNVPNIVWKTVRILKGLDDGVVTSNLNAIEGLNSTVVSEGQKYADYQQKANQHTQNANTHITNANTFRNTAAGFVRGVNVYGALFENHQLVTLLLLDSKGDNNPANDTGRYAGYRNQVEALVGVQRCTKIGTAPLTAGTYINGTNPVAWEDTAIENYDDPNVGPFKPSPIPGATLISWDSDDKNGPEKWYVNHATKKMTAAEKLPIYKKHDCTSNELLAQISHGQLGTDITALHNSKFFERNYVYKLYKDLADPINALVEQANSTHKNIETLKTDYENSGSTYWEALAYAPDGQIKAAKYGNGVESSWKYDPRGRTYEIQAGKGSGDLLQDMFFDYDNIGNLIWRDDKVNQYDETFTYDALNRLKSATLAGGAAFEYVNLGIQSTSYDYDALGNLIYKSDVGNYTYGTGIGGGAGVHAVVSTDGVSTSTYNFAATSFSYDSNGNQISGNGRTVTYSPFNKPTKIVKGANVNDFVYGPERQLIYQKEKIHDQYRETRYVGGIYEETIKDGDVNNTEAVHHLTMAGHTIAVLKTKTDLSTLNSLHYLHQDHLDSVVMITDNNGRVVEKNHYDPFGKKRLAFVDNPTIYSAGFLPITDRSFTGHRYLPEQELIHMKGRVYDPVFGRFLSPDPHIQSPLNSQSLNRYSYVLNNPLSLTDPSGYFFSWFKKLFKKILKVIKKIIKKVVKIIKKVIKAIEKIITKIVMALPVEIRIIAAIVVAVYAPQIAGAISSVFGGASTALGTFFATKIGIGAVGGFLAGLISTGSFKGALIGGLTGAAFGAVGARFSNVASNNINAARLAGGSLQQAGRIASGVFRGLTTGQAFLQSLAHGIVGGLNAKLSGGSFSKGLLIGFLNKIASPIVSSTNSFVSLVRHTAFAGVVSKIAGGSFSRGARIGFMATLFNEIASGRGGKLWADTKKIIDKFGSPPASLGFGSVGKNRDYFRGIAQDIGYSDGEYDALRHCGQSCTLTSDTNRAVTEVLGNGREILDPNNYTNGQINEIGQQDIHNNNVGIDLGIGAPNRDYCPALCIDAINNGAASTAEP